MSLRIDRPTGGVLVLDVTGDLDLATCDGLLAGVLDAAETGAAEVILDLRRVTFIDSTGLLALFEASRHVYSRGQALKVASGARSVDRLFDLTGARDRLSVIDGQEVARARADERGTMSENWLG